MSTRKRDTTSKSSQSSRTGSGKNEPKDIFFKATEIYLDLVEKSAPKVKQAMDDLYDFWLGSFDTVLQIQKTAFNALGVDSKTLEKSEVILKKTVREAVEAQKKASDISTKAYLDVIKSIQNEIKVA